MMVLGHNILVLKILMTNPTLARALSTDFSSLRSINLSRGLVMDGWHFGRHREWKVFLVPLLTCKSLPQQHFEGQAASCWDRRRALRAKEPWKGPEQDLATNKFSFDKNCVQCIILFYLQWVWHKAIKISKKFTVNLIKVGVIEIDHQINMAFDFLIS